jgi:predicted nucleic acid-binding protein
LATDPLVVDASAVVKAALVPDGFQALAAFALHAPTLLWSEVTAALRQLEWRNEISADEGAAALQRALTAAIRAHKSADLAVGATRAARQLGWAKTYDAEYVALAQSLDAPLLTIDARLRRAVARSVTVLVPADLV